MKNLKVGLSNNWSSISEVRPFQDKYPNLSTRLMFRKKCWVCGTCLSSFAEAEVKGLLGLLARQSCLLGKFPISKRHSLKVGGYHFWGVIFLS